VSVCTFLSHFISLHIKFSFIFLSFFFLLRLSVESIFSPFNLFSFYFIFFFLLACSILHSLFRNSAPGHNLVSSRKLISFLSHSVFPFDFCYFILFYFFLSFSVCVFEKGIEKNAGYSLFGWNQIN
jgi:hypothetical protein